MQFFLKRHTKHQAAWHKVQEMQPLSQRGGAPAQDQQASRRAHGQGCIRAGTGGDKTPAAAPPCARPPGLAAALAGAQRAS